MVCLPRPDRPRCSDLINPQLGYSVSGMGLDVQRIRHIRIEAEYTSEKIIRVDDRRSFGIQFRGRDFAP